MPTKYRWYMRGGWVWLQSNATGSWVTFARCDVCKETTNLIAALNAKEGSE